MEVLSRQRVGSGESKKKKLKFSRFWNTQVT